MKYHCPICGSESVKNKIIGSYIQCSVCHSLFTTSFPSQKTITEKTNRWASSICSTSVVKKATKDIKKRIELIKKETKGKTLLDVGCGDGSFLLAVKNGSFTVSGMDIAKPFQEYLSKQGISMYSSLKTIPSRLYDIVTCFDVIEHTTNPEDFIEELHRITKPKGYLLLTTPNAGSVSARVLGKRWWVLGPEGHYVLFSVQSLQNFLEGNGYKIISAQTDTFTQWFQPANRKKNKVLNKCVYLLMIIFLPLLYRVNFGDNIQILARKK